ncbi:MAG: response regulator [Eubacterium sp.]|nr:response regulator [Eubacterium sp.]
MISNRSPKNTISPYWLIFLGIFSVITAVLILSYFFPYDNGLWWKGEYTTASNGWVVRSESLMRQNQSIPFALDIDPGEKYSIERQLPADLDDGSVVMYYAFRQDVTVSVNGKMIYNFKGSDQPYQWITIPVDSGDAGKTLSLAISSTHEGYGGTVNHPVYIGDKSAIIWHLLSANALSITLGVILIIFSLLILVYYAFFSKGADRTMEIPELSLLIFLVGLWLLTQNDSRQIYSDNMYLMEELSFIAVYMAPPCAMKYIMHLLKKHTNPVLNFLFYADVIAAIPLNMALHLWSYPIIETLWACRIVLGSNIILAASAVVWEIFRDRTVLEKNTLVLLGFAGFSLGVLTDVVSSALGLKYPNNFGTAAGTLIFGVCAFRNFIINSVEGSKEREYAHKKNLETTEFLENMSHAIRTPLNAILGADALIIRESRQKDVVEYANDIKTATGTLMDTIDDILDISKVEANSITLVEQPYNTIDLIHNSCQLVWSRAKDKQLEFRLVTSAHLPGRLIGDERRITQIMLNLLNNAVKYTSSGTITLYVRWWMKENDRIQLEITVSDTGQGIKHEDQTVLFDRFSRLNESKNEKIEGSGLGLSIAHSLTEKMGGTLLVRSVFGKGSDFRFSIPQVVEDWTPTGKLAISQDNGSIYPMNQESESAQENVIVRDTPTWFEAPKMCILAVDDTPMNLKVLKRMMKPSLIQIDTAGGGQEAVAMTQKRKYDLIMMDHIMPDMDGIETRNAIVTQRQNPNANTPFIMFTANAIAGSKEKYIAEGFDGYLAKPIKENELISVLKKALEI